MLITIHPYTGLLLLLSRTEKPGWMYKSANSTL
jgi:hypothetical protein